MHELAFVGVQSLSLGLGEQWEKVKTAYAQANRALGDIVKVTPIIPPVSPSAHPPAICSLLTDNTERLCYHKLGICGAPAESYLECIHPACTRI